MTIDAPPANPGLAAHEVAERVRLGQVNHLPPRSGRSTWDIVRANVFTRINAILAVLFVLVLSTGYWFNAAFGFLIIVNSAIGIVQELRAKQTLDNLAVVGEARPLVRRDGATIAVGRTEIVLDDVIEVGPGDQIVVDGDVIEASYLEVDESLLTGESDAVEKGPGDPVMSGSFVVAGSGAYRAAKVGADAYAAQLTAEAAKFTLVRSELQQGINKILRLITWLMVPVGLATIWVQLTQAHETWQEAVLRMAGALVPMVPEGLVLLTSMAFAIGVIRLGQRNCLVQELPAIEGLARVDVVCADKTGTLTENGMRFAELIPLAEADPDECRSVLAHIAASDPRPNASIQAIAHAMPPVEDAWEVTALAPFTSAKKWSGASFVDHGHWAIGAPDVLADPASDAAGQAEEIGASGRRVLLLGRCEAPVDDDEAPGTVVPQALLVLDQKVRPEARETLDYFAQQDVALKVISGDNATSVGAVTRALGVTRGEVVDARTLPEDGEEFVNAVVEASVFGRVTPRQKRQMVSALQSRGHTVAMTGDGVNDVLAIKDADLGVAMGTGSAATRAVAQIVLLDDSFATLPHVVAEGRRVIGNIERVANFFLTKTIYSILLALLVVVWRIPFPFVPIQITLVGWFTIGIPAFILSLAPNAERARPGFVNRVMRFGLPAGVTVAIATFATYVLVMPPPGAPANLQLQASTAALVCLLVVGTWVMVVITRPYEWWKVLMLVVCVLAYVVIFSLPLGQWIFSLDPSNTEMLSLAFMFGLAGAAVVEAIWWIGGLTSGEKRHLWKPAEA